MKYHVKVTPAKKGVIDVFDIETESPETVVGFIHGLMQTLHLPATIVLKVSK